MFRVRVTLAVLAMSALGGCAAQTPEMIANNDPFEPSNRATLALNGKIDRHVVMPAVDAYFTSYRTVAVALCATCCRISPTRTSS